MILSLQGCMAVGKTTAARYLQAHDPQLHVCFEDNAAVIAEVKHRGLDKNCYADYLEIQRLFLQNEVRRWQEAQKYPCTVMDFGAEEIVFYTLHYPKSKGLDWDVEELRRALAPELAAAQGCMPEHILFKKSIMLERFRKRCTKNRFGVVQFDLPLRQNSDLFQKFPEMNHNRPG